MDHSQRLQILSQKIQKTSSAKGKVWTLVTEYEKVVYIAEFEFKPRKKTTILFGQHVYPKCPRPTNSGRPAKRISKISLLFRTFNRADEHELKLNEILKEIVDADEHKESHKPHLRKGKSPYYIETVRELELESVRNGLEKNVSNSRQTSTYAADRNSNFPTNLNNKKDDSGSEAETEMIEQVCFSELDDDLVQLNSTASPSKDFNPMVKCCMKKHEPVIESVSELAYPISDVLITSMTEGKTNVHPRVLSGFGVFAAKNICQGEFVLGLSGDFMTRKAGILRETLCRPTQSGEGRFIFFFRYNGRRCCIDGKASQGHGKYVIYSSSNPNVVLQVIEMPSVPKVLADLRVMFVAIRDIVRGEEILCNYRSN